MAEWRPWYQMALASQKAAQSIETTDPRSSVSRIYYAAYQAVTAVLLYSGATPPADREAWNHEVTPDLLIEKWEPLIRSLDKRQDLARRLRRLYELRISADYISQDPIGRSTVTRALRDGNYMIKVVTDLLPGE